ncbi:MAG: RodZ domain-containing protein [Sulfuriferula sp.]
MHEDELSVDTLSVGAQLCQARTAMQLSMMDIAQRLKISPQQIALIEDDDFNTIGLVFSRGFVRQYARHVGLDADSLVAAMSGNLQRKAESLSVHNEEIPLSKGLSKYWLVLFIGAITLVIGIPLALYYWLSGDTASATPKKTVITPPPIIAPAKQPLTPAAALLVTPVPAEGKEATANSDVSNAVTTSTTDIATGRMSFKFDTDSWVEIRDGSNHTVLSHLYRAGETAEISGTPPLSLVIGNAAKVSLQYNDQPVDLTPHTGVTVARVTLK